MGGKSFQVGKRFWDIINARRDELRKLQPCSCGNLPGSPDGVAVDSDDLASAAAQKKAEEHAAKLNTSSKAQDGVITLLAQEAQASPMIKPPKPRPRLRVLLHAQRHAMLPRKTLEVQAERLLASRRRGASPRLRLYGRLVGSSPRTTR